MHTQPTSVTAKFCSRAIGFSNQIKFLCPLCHKILGEGIFFVEVVVNGYKGKRFTIPNAVIQCCHLDTIIPLAFETHALADEKARTLGNEPGVKVELVEMVVDYSRN